MAELKRRILEVIERPQLCSLATVTEEGKPWTRYVMAVADSSMTLRCATFVEARKVAQIEQNPEVHLTGGVDNLEHMAPYVQVQARAELTTAQEERHAFWNPALGRIFEGPNDPHYGLIVMTPYRIELCTPGSRDPEVWEA